MPSKTVSEKISVNITLFPPFSRKRTKDENTMTFEGELTVKDLIDYLVINDDHFATHLGEVTGEEGIRSRALIIHNDHIGSLNEMVRDGDSLKFLHPLQGG